MVTSKKLSGTAALIFFIYCTIALSQNARDPKGARPYRGMRMRAVMRRNEAHERSRGGVGLGLSIVKSIMSAIGGTVRAESEAGKDVRSYSPCRKRQKKRKRATESAKNPSAFLEILLLDFKIIHCACRPVKRSKLKYLLLYLNFVVYSNRYFIPPDFFLLLATKQTEPCIRFLFHRV